MTLKDQLKENTDSFVHIIREFPEEQFNTKPDADSWSAGEVTEHIYRSEFGIPKLYNGKTEPLENRETDSKVQEMEELFLRSDKKIKAGGVILPSEGAKSKEALITRFKQNRHTIGELIETQDMDKLCLRFEHPLFGHLTRREWALFIIMHTKRHMKQIERIREHIG